MLKFNMIIASETKQGDQKMTDQDQLPPPASKNNLIKLSDVLNDCTMYTPEDMLEEAIERVRGNKGIKKGIVILFDELAPFDEQILWHSVGLTKAQHLRLLSNAQEEYLVEYALGHTHNEEDL